MNEFLPSKKSFEKYVGVLNELFRFTEINVILEFGSRYGEDTIEFAKVFPESRIYAFECNPTTLLDCKTNTKSFKNIYLSPYAISNKNGKEKFYPIDSTSTKTTWSDGNQGASSLFKASGKYPIENYIQLEIEVDCIRLDTFMNDNFIQEIDAIWMDVQGAELLALEGLGDYISRVKTIHLEVEFFEIYSNQPFFKDIKSFFRKNNFVFLGFTNKGEYSGDAIFLNKNLNIKNSKLKYIREKYELIYNPNWISKILSFAGL